jgi:hypothetical protein
MINIPTIVTPKKNKTLYFGVVRHLGFQIFGKKTKQSIFQIIHPFIDRGWESSGKYQKVDHLWI